MGFGMAIGKSGDAVPEPSVRHLEKLFIDFDGQQIEVETDAPEVRELLAEEFSMMLTPEASAVVGNITVGRTDDGIRVRGEQEFDLGRLDATVACECVKHEVLKHFVRLRKDLLWLHAGAVERNGSALVFPGESGRGKSTLVTLLARNGWGFLSDEIVPLRMDAEEVFAYPLRAQRRIGVGRELSLDDVYSLDKERVEIAPGTVHREWAHVAATIFPRFESGARARLTRLPAGDAALALLRNALNFLDHKAAAVSRGAASARRIPAYELVYDRSGEAGELLQSVLQ
jgi:hypothetical protein